MTFDDYQGMSEGDKTRIAIEAVRLAVVEQERMRPVSDMPLRAGFAEGRMQWTQSAPGLQEPQAGFDHTPYAAEAHRRAFASRGASRTQAAPPMRAKRISLLRWIARFPVVLVHALMRVLRLK